MYCLNPQEAGPTQLSELLLYPQGKQRLHATRSAHHHSVPIPQHTRSNPALHTEGVFPYICVSAEDIE